MNKTKIKLGPKPRRILKSHFPEYTPGCDLTDFDASPNIIDWMVVSCILVFTMVCGLTVGGIYHAIMAFPALGGGN